MVQQNNEVNVIVTTPTLWSDKNALDIWHAEFNQAPPIPNKGDEISVEGDQYRVTRVVYGYSHTSKWEKRPTNQFAPEMRVMSDYPVQVPETQVVIFVERF